MKKNNEFDIVNRDNEGNIIEEAFPVSKRTKKDQRKTSVGYSLVAFLLHVLAIIPLIAVSVVLAVKTYDLTPYYSFWCFIGVIIVGVFGLIYAIVTLIVTRKKSKSSISSQTAKVAITFVCLTCVFSLILTYIVPDIIALATQNTMYVEDLYYKGDEQAETNAKLDRDFIMYNVLNGNLNDNTVADGDYSYKTLSKRLENEGGALLYEKNKKGEWIGKSFVNDEIDTSFKAYLNGYKNIGDLRTKVIEPMKENQPRKYELYQFIYNVYVLNDFNYAFFNDIHRPILALSILDYEYSHSGYESLLKEGFSNKRVKYLFDKNFDNFNQDGYQTFDDPLLLYAQLPSRMTVPVVLRLILNEGWMYSQPSYDADGNCYFTEDGNMLYEVYDADTRDAYEAAYKEEYGEDSDPYMYTGTLMGRDGNEMSVKYGFNKDGWMVYENGVVQRPINWLVLDMLGDKMDLTSLDISGGVKSLLGLLVPGAESMPDDTIKTLFNGILDALRLLFDSTGELVQDDLQNVIEYATNGANINIGLYIDDNDMLAVNIYPMNYEYGMLGYMQASWVQSNNLLMAVINVIGLRNWLCIFGALGVVLVIAAGVIRECGRKTRLRTAVSRDRIVRERTSKKVKNGEELQLAPAMDENGNMMTPSGDDENVALEDEPVVEEKKSKKKNKKNKDVEPEVEPSVEEPLVEEESTPVYDEPVESVATKAVEEVSEENVAETEAPEEVHEELDSPEVQAAEEEAVAVEAPVEDVPVVEEYPMVEEAPAEEMSAESAEAPVEEVDNGKKKKKKKKKHHVEEATLEALPPEEEAPQAEEAPQLEEVAPLEEVVPQEEAPVLEEVVFEEEPKLEEAPVLEEVPTEEAPQLEEVAPLEEVVPQEEAPVLEEVAAVEETPVVEEPALEELPKEEVASEKKKKAKRKSRGKKSDDDSAGEQFKLDEQPAEDTSEIKFPTYYD